MKQYELTPEIYVESFDEDAVLLVADEELLLTVDRSTAALYELFRSTLSGRPFTLPELENLLFEHYDLTETEASAKATSLLAFGLRHRMVRLRGLLS